MSQDIYLLATFVLTVFAVKIIANRFGMGYGILTFFVAVTLVGVGAGTIGLEIVGSDCYDYGVRAKGC